MKQTFSIVVCYCALLLIGSAGLTNSEQAELGVGARDDGTGKVTLYVQIVKASETTLKEGSTQHSAIPGAQLQLDTVDEIHIKTEKKEDRKIGIFLPPGWTEQRDGDDVKLTGPPISIHDGCFFSLDLGKTKIPKDASIQIYSKGKKIIDRKFNVVLLPTFQFITSMNDLPAMPRTALSGEEIHFTTLDPRQTHPDGKWMVGDVPATRIEEVDHSQIRYQVQVPTEANPGTSLNVIYTDPWSNRIVNVTDGIKILAGKEEKPRITNCTPQSFPGNVICVCGWFPNRSWEKLLVDGKPAGMPLGASIGTVHLQLQSDIAAGEHVVSGDAAAGFRPEDRARTRIIFVGGELDRNKLWKGDTTPMRLWVAGTPDVLQLHVRNVTPSIITLEGGNDQMIPTSGGNPNQLQKTVRGISPGNFEIKYDLTIERCPCAYDDDDF